MKSPSYSWPAAVICGPLLVLLVEKDYTMPTWEFLLTCLIGVGLALFASSILHLAEADHPLFFGEKLRVSHVVILAVVLLFTADAYEKRGKELRAVEATQLCEVCHEEYEFEYTGLRQYGICPRCQDEHLRACECCGMVYPENAMYECDGYLCADCLANGLLRLNGEETVTEYFNVGEW